jgi:hypothetical protein
MELTVEHDLDRDELLGLYDSVGWTADTRTPEELVAAVANSTFVVTARDDGCW